MGKLRELIIERNQLRDELSEARSALESMQGAVTGLTTERDKLRSERDELRSNKQFYGVMACSATTFACSGAAVLSAHNEWYVAAFVPALVTAAISLRDVPVDLRNWVFVALVTCLLATSGFHVYTRVSDRARCTRTPHARVLSVQRCRSSHRTPTSSNFYRMDLGAFSECWMCLSRAGGV